MDQDDEKTLLRAWHDLGAPLRAIRLLVDMTREDGEPLGPQTRKNLELVCRRALRAESLVDQLLEYLMLRVQPEGLQWVDTGDVAREAIEVCADSGFALVKQGQWPALNLPAQAFRRSLDELLTNAIKHHGAATGHITLSGQAIAGGIEVAVSDDGKGIDDRFHDAVFEFGKTLQSQDQIEGNGLGLTLIRQALAVYGGGISVRSVPGQGACFSMRWQPDLAPGD